MDKTCIICGFAIIVVILLIYLFSKYYKQGREGFEISSSLTASSQSPSEFGNIGPLPLDNKWSDETITNFKAAYKTNNSRGRDITDAALTNLYKVATDEEAQGYIQNGHWDLPDYYNNCIDTSYKKIFKDESIKNNTPPPTDEQMNTFIAGIKKAVQTNPLRMAIKTGIDGSTVYFGECIDKIKETIFLKQISYNPTTSNSNTSFKLTDNRELKCKSNNGKFSLMTTTLNPSTGETITSIETPVSDIPTLIPGFKFVKDSASCDICNNTQSCPFTINDEAVSPFYQAYWGMPASTGAISAKNTTSTPESVSDGNNSAASLLKQIKAELNANPTI